MYKFKKPLQTSLKVNNSQEGERLEIKIMKATEQKTPIGDGNTVPLIYTERKDGVLPAYDIRADKFDLALDAMDKVAQMHMSARQERLKGKVVEMDKRTEKGTEQGSPGGESSQQS